MYTESYREVFKVFIYMLKKTLCDIGNYINYYFALDIVNVSCLVAIVNTIAIKTIQIYSKL